MNTFQILAEPVRRDILDLLLERERTVNELVTTLALPQPGVSKQLRLLRLAGLVDVRVDAQRRWYGLRPDPLAEIDTWIAPYRRFWSGNLDALEQHLDRMAARDRQASDAADTQSTIPTTSNT